MHSFDAFISYSRHDLELVVQFTGRLRRYGVTVWLDEEQIRPGDRFVSKIEEGLRGSAHVIVCLTPNLKKSSWCKKEYELVLGAEIVSTSTRVIPVELARCAEDDIPFLLRDKSRVDPWNDLHLQALVSQLRTRTVEPPPPEPTGNHANTSPYVNSSLSLDVIIRKRLANNSYISDDEILLLCRRFPREGALFSLSDFRSIIRDYLGGLWSQSNFRKSESENRMLYKRLMENMRGRKVVRNIRLLSSQLRSPEFVLLSFIFGLILEVEADSVLHLDSRTRDKLTLVQEIVSASADEGLELFAELSRYLVELEPYQ